MNIDFKETDNDYDIQIDSECYSQDFDTAYPEEEEIEQKESDILFE